MMAKEKIIPDYELIHNDEGCSQNTFTYRVTCNDLSVTGTSNNKKAAKHEAANAMLKAIEGHGHFSQLSIANESDGSSSKLPVRSAALPSKIPGNLPYFNFVGELQELCMYNNWKNPKYILINDIGPPHAKIFTFRCKIDNFEEDGIANTKQQAKHYAAEKMLNRVKGLSNNLNNFKNGENEDNSLSVVPTVDIEQNENEEATHPEMIKAKALFKFYSTYWKNTLETDKRYELLEQLAYIFPKEFFDKYITIEEIKTKVSKLKTLLSEIDITIDMGNICNTNNQYTMKASLLFCPNIKVHVGMGKTIEEAVWTALCKILNTINLLLK
ncbi:hypothetical protein PUN28_010790 [Cardiocondyla obscurior]